MITLEQHAQIREGGLHRRPSRCRPPSRISQGSPASTQRAEPGPNLLIFKSFGTALKDLTLARVFYCAARTQAKIGLRSLDFSLSGWYNSSNH